MNREYVVNEPTVVRRCRKHQDVECQWCKVNRAYDAPGAVWVWAPATSADHYNYDMQTWDAPGGLGRKYLEGYDGVPYGD